MTEEDRGRLGRATYYLGRILYELKEISSEPSEGERYLEALEDAEWSALRLREALDRVAARSGLLS